MAKLTNIQLKRYEEAKSCIRISIRYSVNRHTQKELLQRARSWVKGYLDNCPKGWPRYYGQSLNAYLEGFFDACVEGKTIFLYKVGGQFYKTSHDDIDLPCWDQLPQEVWGDLGGKGGMYWKESLEPFFIHGDDEA